MFIQDDDVVEIKVYCKKTGYRYDAYTESEFKTIKFHKKNEDSSKNITEAERKDLEDQDSVVEDRERKKFKVLTVTMRLLTWGLYNDLQESAMVMDDKSNDRHFNLKIYKENRLKRLIKKWDAKTEGGKDVPVVDGSIAHLAPDIAEAILRGYDEISFLDEEQEKNS